MLYGLKLELVMSKKTHRKPDRPIGAIIFPKVGPVRFECESLPREQKPLELAIGRKLIGALSHFGYGVYAGLKLADEPADLLCNNEDGELVGIQVTEMVDVVWARLNAHRERYLKELEENSVKVLEMFSGCSIEIMDDGTEDFFPPLNTSEGQYMLKELECNLAMLAKDIDELKLKKIIYRKWELKTAKTGISVICQRHMKATCTNDYKLNWGTQRAWSAGYKNALLSNTVSNKIQKRYSSVRHEFWLLVYSTDIVLSADDVSFGIAATLLDNSSHQFDKVWFFYPYQNKDLGHVVQVWAK